MNTHTVDLGYKHVHLLKCVLIKSIVDLPISNDPFSMCSCFYRLRPICMWISTKPHHWSYHMNSRAIRRLSNSIRKLHGTVTMIIRMCTYYAMLVVKKNVHLLTRLVHLVTQVCGICNCISLNIVVSITLISGATSNDL